LVVDDGSIIIGGEKEKWEFFFMRWFAFMKA